MHCVQHTNFKIKISRVIYSLVQGGFRCLIQTKPSNRRKIST